MEEWRLRPSELKRYPHFDPVISAAEAEAIATDPGSVAKHKFYPFIRYTLRWTRYAPKGERGDPKEREIRYAARRDAYIFAYYRHQLSTAYEAELKRLNLDKSVLAYRRVDEPTGAGGKCNIDFALDAVLRIRELGNCCVVALDISKFFESLDHERLKRLWSRMLGVEKLPIDHYKVFKAITQYSIVDKHAVYERLGYYGPKRKTNGGKIISGYLTPYRLLPKQLCSGEEFRKRIAGSSQLKSIIQTHYKPYGIPQGAPISDLLANLYLLDFDNEISTHLRTMKGTYYRYSDDILLIAPGDASTGLALEALARNAIMKYGDNLRIKEEKSSVIAYQASAEGRQRHSLIKGTQGKTGLEYLGFRYHGWRIHIRNSTIQNLYRKVTMAARREAMTLAKRFPDKPVSHLKKLCNYEAFIARFGRVEDFDELRDDYKKWTFWTYAQRATVIMGRLGTPIKRQLRNQRTIIKAKLDAEFARAVSRRK